MRQRLERLLPWVLAVGLVGCAGFVPDAGQTASFGSPQDGVLRRGVSLPDEGPGFVRARRGESTRYGTPGLVGAIVRAAARVERRHPGGAPLRVGDLSAPSGGRHPRHNSHRTGRDADLLFYAHDAAGDPVGATGFLRFDRFGVARFPEGAPHAGQLAFLDEARNWALVRSLLLDREAPVQWIFCSNGVKAQLLEYAATHDASAQVLFRAAWVLHEPSRGRRHADHFHVRLACTAEQRALGCIDRGPIWPWIRKAVGKPAEVGGGLTDKRLVRALLGPRAGGDDGDRRVSGAPVTRPGSARSRVAIAAP